MLKQEIAEIKSDPKAIREFGLVVGGVLGLIGLVRLWKGHGGAEYFLIAAGLLIFFGLFAPALLRPVQKVWMIFALLLGWVMTRVILSLVFYLAITPIGIIMRLSGKDPLDEKYPDKRATFWTPKGQKRTRESYEKQF